MYCEVLIALNGGIVEAVYREIELHTFCIVKEYLNKKKK